MRKSKKSAPEKSILQMIRERQARMDLNPDLSELDIDMPWPLLERTWTCVYCTLPVQSQTVSYRDFMMDLKETALERERTKLGIPLKGWHTADVESTKLRQMFKGIGRQRRIDNDDEMDDDDNWIL